MKIEEYVGILRTSDGRVEVVVEPTEEMCTAEIEERINDLPDGVHETETRIYNAALISQFQRSDARLALN